MNTHESPHLADAALAAVVGGSDPTETPDAGWPWEPGVPLSAWPVARGVAQIELTPPPYELWGMQL